MWGFNGTARVPKEYTDKASNKHLLLEPVDMKKDRYGFVYAPTRNGEVPYNPRSLIANNAESEISLSIRFGRRLAC
jgi:hypothetical protein